MNIPAIVFARKLNTRDDSYVLICSIVHCPSYSVHCVVVSQRYVAEPLLYRKVNQLLYSQASV